MMNSSPFSSIFNFSPRRQQRQKRQTIESLSGSTGTKKWRMQQRYLFQFIFLFLLLIFFITSIRLISSSSSSSSSTTNPNSSLEGHLRNQNSPIESILEDSKKQQQEKQQQHQKNPKREQEQQGKTGGGDEKSLANSNNENGLPLAKSLLDKAPPYQESDIIKFSDTLTSSPNTIVTAYFRVRSKFNPEKYNRWMANMLSIQDAMVIFTHTDMIEQIKSMRSHALDKTVIIQMDINDLPIGTLFTTEFWQQQLDRDPEKKIHKSYQLFWIWLSKSWCTTEAIKWNFFQSDLFVWSDIGCFRDKNYNSITLVQHREQVPADEMIQMAHHRPNPPQENLYSNKYNRNPHYYHSGSQFAGYKDTWVTFHAYFLDIIDQFLANDMIIVEDQVILQSVCLTHPEICAYVPYDQVSDNNYFGLKLVLSRGGNFQLWRHPSVTGGDK